MRNFAYTSVERIISKVYRESGAEDISETDLIEYIGEALEAIGAINIYEEAVAFIEVSNHTAELPRLMHSVIQIARDNEASGVNRGGRLSPREVIQLVDNNQQAQANSETCADSCNQFEGSTAGYPVPLDCRGAPIIPFEVDYYRPYFDLQFEYLDWANSGLYRDRFTTVRPANHTFFESVNCSDDLELYGGDIHDEYSLQGGVAKFSFKEGQIALSYTRQKVDERGYPMIIDTFSVNTAITSYIMWKMSSRYWMMGREGYADKVQKFEADWHWYCKQAGNELLIPYGVDGLQNLLEVNKLIPTKEKFKYFFGRQSQFDRETKFNRII